MLTGLPRMSGQPIVIIAPSNSSMLTNPDLATSVMLNASLIAKAVPTGDGPIKFTLIAATLLSSLLGLFYYTHDKIRKAVRTYALYLVETKESVYETDIAALRDLRARKNLSSLTFGIPTLSGFRILCPDFLRRSVAVYHQMGQLYFCSALSLCSLVCSNSCRRGFHDVGCLPSVMSQKFAY